jgi:UPF0755 protein
MGAPGYPQSWKAIVAMRLVTLSVLLSVACGVAVYAAHQTAQVPFKAYPGDEVFFTVSAGESSASVARALSAEGIIKDAGLFLAALWVKGATGRVQAGEYHFEGETSLWEVVDRLVAGDVSYRTVTIPEGLTVTETAELLSKQGLGDADELTRAFGRGTLVASLDPGAEDLEGYLFPDTYRFPRRPTTEEVARVLVSRFLGVFDGVRQARTAALDLSVREAVTLASVVEKETGRPEERALIASVFWNRLRRGMRLQSDPTVIYGLKRDGRFDGNLRRGHLRMETPYNTYVRTGLPAGPIASPGKAAIDAVLDPAQSKYLYFVSRNDGSHHFSASLREHNAAVRKYQIEYFRKQRTRRRARAAGLS